MENFNDLLIGYVSEIQTKHDQANQELNEKFGASYYTFKADKPGKRFVKVLLKTVGSEMFGSVHCFVEIATGHIYKPAGWSAPAKGIRGNLANEKRPIFCGDFYAR